MIFTVTIVIPSEARSIREYSFTHNFHIPYKISFLLAIASRSPSLTVALRLPNMDGYLQKNTEGSRILLSCLLKSSNPVVPVKIMGATTNPRTSCQWTR
jgi:hypothetical protein